MFWVDSVNVVSQSQLEKAAEKCYIRSMFTLFQKEFKTVGDCFHKKMNAQSTTKLYKVGLCTDEESKWYCVPYDQSQLDVSAECECGKFETDVYLC
ncbi:hypothetical protein CFOL_v3_16919 [Cephalotus follicularis]|uniref:Uncharacterized protein n=1 Tax=Cephalotus follicularis TaxID=3775 RepID=A0A1Q3C087_CEPFO|nr:hypothetical protein CFOL_v3_16919 [Cephalotus follicularis]